MALSNPFSGQRLPGYVGQPLPGMYVKLVRENGSEIPESSSESGELLVSGVIAASPALSCSRACNTQQCCRSFDVFALH